MIAQTVVYIVQLAIIYSLIALGLTLVFGIMGILNFAHGEMYMLGGFAAYYFFSQVGLSYIPTLLIGILLVGLVGIIVERIILRPFRGELLQSFIVTLGLALVLQVSTLMGFGTQDKTVPSYFVGTATVGGVSFSIERIAVSIIGLILILALYLFIQRARIGQAMRAVAQDTDAASLQGVNVAYVCSMGMGLGCALAAAAGILMAPVYIVNPYMGSLAIFRAFIIVIVGGLGSIPGALLGAVILAAVETIGTIFVGASVATMIGFGIVVVMLMMRPSGLLGRE